MVFKISGNFKNQSGRGRIIASPFMFLYGYINGDKLSVSAFNIHKSSGDHDSRYVTKSMMSGQKVNDSNKVPTSALLYSTNNNLQSQINDLVPKEISSTANAYFIKSGNVTCYKIKDVLHLIFSDVRFQRSESFGLKSQLLWTLGASSNKEITFILKSVDSVDTVRLFLTGNQIYGHYSQVVDNRQYCGVV